MIEQNLVQYAYLEKSTGQVVMFYRLHIYIT
jgi:hypothetical protein